MSSYGRNFEFRVPPHGGERGGRYALAGSDVLPIGAPVVVTGDFDALGRAEVVLASEAADAPLPGAGGVLVYEYGPAAFAGDDPWLTTYSDKGSVKVGEAVQVVNGSEVKVVLRNVGSQGYPWPAGEMRTYDEKNLVAPTDLDGSPVAVGDMLTVGAGNDSDGYWKKTTDAAACWAVVTKVDTARGEVEARLNF